VAESMHGTLARDDVKTHTTDRVPASDATTSLATTIRSMTLSPGGVRSRLAIALSLFALYLIWGSTYLGMRIALEGFPPFQLAGIRFLVAGGILYTILRVRGAPSPSRREWAGALLLGALLLVGGNGGVVFAEQWVASGLAALGIAAVPLWAALFFGLWGRWPRRLEWLGLGLGFAGVVLLNLENGVRAAPIGAIALLLAPMSWALGSAWSQHVQQPKGLMSSAAQMLAGGGILMVVSFVLREGAPHIATARPLVAMGFLVLFGSLIAFSAYGYLLRRVRPALATSYAYVNPVVAVALGVGLAGEHITAVGLLAMLIILSGVGLVSLVRQRR
jgi:drug/metabolite transporter (DMT)-like permease